jgi:hypothetical protein
LLGRSGGGCGRSGTHTGRNLYARNALKSAGVVLLLFAVVASTIAGAETAFFTVLTAWVLFPMLVGFRNTLDAGCAFMLISVGVVVVELARNGPGSLLT